MNDIKLFSDQIPVKTITQCKHRKTKKKLYNPFERFNRSKCLYLNRPYNIGNFRNT